MEREISIVLKVRGAASAKKAVQDVFNNQTTQAVIEFNKRVKSTGDNLEKAGRKAKKAKTEVSSFTKTLGRGMAALYLYRRAWDLLGSRMEEGGHLERASRIFSDNVGNITKMLPELRAATKGVVSDMDLLRASNRAFQQGLRPENMTKAFKMGAVAAQKLDMEATTAISAITSALTKQDEGALNTLGIITNVNQAYKTQAAIIAKNGGVMSQAMSIQLRQSLIIKELEKRFGGANKVQADGLQLLERLRASWSNFKATLGETVLMGFQPFIKALTGVLDVTTSLLDRLNKTEGLKKFVQLMSTLAIVIGTAKFINGAKSLMGLFGFLGGGGAMKMPKILTSVIGLVGKLGKYVLALMPRFKNFLGALSFVAPRLASVLSFIPGWGAALTAVTLLFKPLVSMLNKAWVAGKVFFQLLSNFDEKSGMSRVLREDAEELGYLYNLIENTAKGALYIGAVFKGLGEGIADAWRPIGSMLDWVGDKLDSISQYMFGVKKASVIASDGLQTVSNTVRNMTKYIGLAASVIAMFIPGLQGIGIAGGLMFGGSIAKDLGAGDMLQSMYTKASDMFSPTSATAPAVPLPASTQMETPTPRAYNLEGKEDPNEINKKILKILEKQTGMMEVDSQKSDIRYSQDQARNSIIKR